MYQQIYLPYYNKLGFIQTEMDLRQSELNLVYGIFDSEGGLLEYGMQTVLGKERDKIQENLDFQEYLGTNIWQEFVAYRREDTYSNTNYVPMDLETMSYLAKQWSSSKRQKTRLKNPQLSSIR